VIVLVVLAVLAGMAVPALGWLVSAGENVAATRVRTTLVYSQEWALSTGDRTWVEFDTTNEVVSVYAEDPANRGRANRRPLTDPLSRAPMTVPLGAQGVGIAAVDMGGTNEVEFDAEGRPRDASGALLTADGTVTLTGSGTIRVTRNTGLITVD
jgi:Tfp pilus assembly protein FimT